MTMFFYNQKKGFTLIELLVVISIITLLSSVVISSLNSARAKARDTRRQVDIRQIETALALYYNEYGAYPISGGAIAPNNSWTTSNDSSWTTLGTALRPYISTLPHDPAEAPSTGSTIWPVNGYNAYTYFSYDDPFTGCLGGKFYALFFRTEAVTITSPGIKMCDGNVYYSGLPVTRYIAKGMSQI